MTDIFYEIELGRIKKRFGNLVSINAELTAEFAFVPDEIESLTRIFAVWDRTDLTEEEAEQYPLMSELENNKCVIPSALFSRPGAYSLTVIGWNEGGDEPAVITDYDDIPDTSSFRSTEAFRGYILESGFQNYPYAASYGDGIFESIKTVTTDKVCNDFLDAVNAQLDPEIESTDNLPAVIAQRVQGLNLYIAGFVAFATAVYGFAADNLEYDGDEYSEETHDEDAFDALDEFITGGDAENYVEGLKSRIAELESKLKNEYKELQRQIRSGTYYTITDTDIDAGTSEGQARIIVYRMLSALLGQFSQFINFQGSIRDFLTDYFSLPSNLSSAGNMSYFISNQVTDEIESLRADSVRASELEPVYDALYHIITTYLQYTTNGNWHNAEKMLEYVADDDDSTGTGIKILQGWINAAARAINFVNTSMDGDFDLTVDLETTLEQFYDYLYSDGDYEGAGAAEYLESFRNKLAAALNESSPTKTFDDLIDDVEDINGQSQTILNTLYSFYTGGNT